MNTLRFLSRQLLALVTAVISGLAAGQLLSLLPGLLFDLLDPALAARYQLWIQAAFWLIPFLVSLCVSLLISLVVRKKPGRAAA
jgi:hypothetical protein